MPARTYLPLLGDISRSIAESLSADNNPYITGNFNLNVKFGSPHEKIAFHAHALFSALRKKIRERATAEQIRDTIRPLFNHLPMPICRDILGLADLELGDNPSFFSALELLVDLSKPVDIGKVVLMHRARVAGELIPVFHTIVKDMPLTACGLLAEKSYNTNINSLIVAVTGAIVLSSIIRSGDERVHKLRGYNQFVGLIIENLEKYTLFTPEEKTNFFKLEPFFEGHPRDATTFISAFAVAAYSGHPEIYLEHVSKLPTETQLSLWKHGRIDDTTPGKGVHTHANKSTLELIVERGGKENLTRAIRIITESEYPFLDKISILNQAAGHADVYRARAGIIQRQIDALRAETSRGCPFFAAFTHRLDQMNWNGDGKKQAVIVALVKIMNEVNTREERSSNDILFAIKNNLDDRTSELYKALNIKRWIGFFAGETGSYQAIRETVDRAYINTVAGDLSAGGARL